MQPEWSWGEMLDAFRALGGTAENIRFEHEKLFAGDPAQQVRLRVPENLVFPLETREIADGRLRLKDAEAASSAVRSFFEHYERAFGPVIFAQAYSAITALESLPAQVKDALKEDFGMRQSFEGSMAQRIERNFVQRRVFWRNERRLIAPVLELARHNPGGLAIEHANGMRIAGSAPNEVGVFHPFHDAVAIFERFGFAAAQPVAFSLPMSFGADGIEIAIERNMHLGERRGETTIPQLNVVAGRRLALSYLQLGHSAAPRRSRGIFCTRMRDADLKDPDWHFDRVVQENTAKLLKLLDVLEGEKGPAILMLKRMARHQLEAMSWSIGSRET